MKAILVIDMPSDCNHCQFADFSNGQWECNQHKGGRIGESMKICSTPSWCPLEHPLKYVSNDFYIYDTKYLMANLDREINLLKGTKAFEEIMEKQNEQDE